MVVVVVVLVGTVEEKCSTKHAPIAITKTIATAVYKSLSFFMKSYLYAYNCAVGFQNGPGC